jgi:benzodiazapine receptor
LNKFRGILLTFGATFAAAAIGSVASVNAGSFYRTLSQPSWAPPAAVFGPVWTVLYLLMAFAAWIVYRSESPNRHKLIGLYLFQLVLNALWSWTFFRWESGLLSMATIVALWIAILATTIGFWRVKPVAGMLLIPYLLWVTFAAALNYAIWQLNPAVL